MANTHNMHQDANTPHEYDAIKQELDELGRQTMTVNGTEFSACHCYYYSLNPPHVLFNDNYPELLKENIRSIFKEHDVELALID